MFYIATNQEKYISSWYKIEFYIQLLWKYYWVTERTINQKVFNHSHLNSVILNCVMPVIDFCNLAASILFDLYVHKPLPLTAVCHYPAAQYFTSAEKPIHFRCICRFLKTIKPARHIPFRSKLFHILYHHTWRNGIQSSGT